MQRSINQPVNTLGVSSFLSSSSSAFGGDKIAAVHANQLRIQDACILAPTPSTPISNKETAPRTPPQLTKKKLRQVDLYSQSLPLPLPPKANTPPSIEDIFDSPRRQRFVLRPRITRHPWTIDAAAYKIKKKIRYWYMYCLKHILVEHESRCIWQNGKIRENKRSHCRNPVETQFMLYT